MPKVVLGPEAANAVKSGVALAEVERHMAPIPPTHGATWRERRI